MIQKRWAEHNLEIEVIMAIAFELLSKIYRGGYEYKKVGVMFDDIHPKSMMQLDLFSEADTPAQERWAESVDTINQTYGKGTVKSASK